MKRILLVLAAAAPAAFGFEEILPINSTSGIWAEGFLGTNFTGGTREEQSLSGFGLNGGAGLAWWVHHNLGLRSRFRFMNYNFRSAPDDPKLTYSYSGYGVSGALMIRFIHENAKVQPYIGGGGGYFWTNYGIRKDQSSMTKIPSDSLSAKAVFGGFVGTLVRIPGNNFWKLELAYQQMGDDYLVDMGTGFSFKILW